MMAETTSRRDFLKHTALVGAGLLSAPAFALESRQISEKSQNQYDFYGKHQAGIVSPAQKHIYFLVLDLDTTDIAKVKTLFQNWTEYSRNLTLGKNVKPYSANAYVPPADTGEADSLSAQNLTLTFGVSANFFTKLGIEKHKPKELNDLPHFPRDQLQAEYTGGDICIQACADDPQVAFHAVRNLVRVARGEIKMKWSQMGFNSFANQDTPRNLFGFKDGTANAESLKDQENTVWVQQEGWLKGGSYLAVRRVKMFLETWDRTHLQSQEETFGRHRDSGAGIGHQHEFDKLDLAQKDEKGNAVIPEVSHAHLANKTGLKILRRSFSYSSGIDDKGQFDSGLLFVSFQQSPEQFIKIQNALGNVDKMNEYITHIGSGLFACFAGVKDENDYLGKALFDLI
ncbi:TPA: deferrochelatase/peroxidase EfeB [Mannheimia haemolytica]|uniref:Deferrochelatase n=1 Tax=Mannheimia haemolytica TaxID=75985 RepID=A0A378NBC2_MANHA|nr:iron uptake transporter deferrochelatase/peroxidase subunit [Mannheimia haemolytica]AGQ37698.1 peroxidase [Mannheimia haemolytica D171]EEY13434.1 putative iron dependent peroxidase [Mannheimia haemolytica serotype A2 str. BOVINE]MDW0534888.1 iron uptake transporter deferrochelatase/peroxidase subunit [Mannheimia haemolytica]MDW0537610.1 iron uptake transporter deferrochelatase/peroxidase subunit [Mannheimia haemolytica]MDW0545005.1 iron uptake transporter deferrochelatase/peroxidase subunit